MKSVCVLMALIVSTVLAEVERPSIADQLQIAQCAFRLYDGPTEVTVLDQMITARAVKNANSELRTFGTAYFIEFTYKGNEMQLENAVIQFLDETRRPLHVIYLNDASRYMKVDTMGHRSNPEIRYIAISLEGIPLRLLDRVDGIRINKG